MLSRMVNFLRFGEWLVVGGVLIDRSNLLRKSGNANEHPAEAKKPLHPRKWTSIALVLATFSPYVRLLRVQVYSKMPIN